jgi:hypothetical protein
MNIHRIYTIHVERTANSFVQRLNARCELNAHALTMATSRIQNFFRQLYTKKSSNRCQFIIPKAHFMEVQPLNPHLDRKYATRNTNTRALHVVCRPISHQCYCLWKPMVRHIWVTPLLFLIAHPLQKVHGTSCLSTRSVFRVIKISEWI